MYKAADASWWRFVGTLFLSGVVASCAMFESKPIEVPKTFKTVKPQNQSVMMTKAEMAEIEESIDPVYLIGRGDVLQINVLGRPEVSGTKTVGPDGKISINMLGDLLVVDLTRDQVRTMISNRLRDFYINPQVSFSVEDYVSNQVTVLGRVNNPGVQRFAYPPTVAEVLAGAGAMAVLDKDAALTRAALIRGRDKLLWMDLKALLQGDLSYNLRMKKGDIIFIPDSTETAIYVMGMVKSPGSYRLSSNMSVLDAISQAGGLHEDAATGQIGIYRPGEAKLYEFSFEELIDTKRLANYELEDGDVVFIPRSGVGTLGYYMRQLSPGLSFLNFGLTLKALEK